MPVEAQTVEYVYLGDGATKVFSFPSKFLSSADVIVGLDGQEQAKGYVVDGAGGELGGSVVFTVAPASGVRVSLLRRPPASQLLDFVNGQTVLEGTLDTGLDKLTMLIQYLLRGLQKSVRLSEFDSSEMPPLPSASERASRVLMFDAAGSLATTALTSVLGDLAIAPFATDSEAVAGTVRTKVVSPANLAARSRVMELRATDFGASAAASGAVNTAALQACVNAAVAAGGGEIVLPANGLLTLSSSVQLNIPKLSAPGLLKIKGRGGLSGFKLEAAASTAPIYVGDAAVTAGGAGVVFEDVRFEGLSQILGRAVRAVNASGLKFIRCLFYNLHFGVQATSSYYVQMLDCMSLNVGAYLFYTDTSAHGFRAIGGAHYNGGIAGTGTVFRFEGTRTDNVVIRDGDYEGCRQVAAFTAGSTCLIVEGNYIEYCTVPAFGFAGVNEMASIRSNWMSLCVGAASVGFDGTNLASGEISRNMFYGDPANRNAVQNVSPDILFNDNKFSGSAVDLSVKQTNVTVFLNGFTAGARTPGYRKQGNAVYLAGELNMGANGDIAFVLPAGLRPRQQQLMFVMGQDVTKTGGVIVDVNGNVVPNMNGATKVNLDGVVVAL